jgi:hypothetical protein
MEKEKFNYEMPPISRWVWIPFDLKYPVSDYNGSKPPLSIIEMGKKKGIVAFRNNSTHEADGEICIDSIGMTTDIERGTWISIKRIHKTCWVTDRYYIMVDVSGQIFIRELLPGDNNKTIRYVSSSFPDGPHIEIQLDRIVVMFSLVQGFCIPRPNRNIVISTTSQL